MDLRGFSRQWIRQFIEIYKSEECLWKAKHPDYGNHIVKCKAYDRLAKKCKEIHPDADRTTVARKINSLRGTFRREFKRKRENKGYQPRLWYYNLLSFVEDQIYPSKKRLEETSETETSDSKIKNNENSSCSISFICEADTNLKHENFSKSSIKNVSEVPSKDSSQLTNTNYPECVELLKEIIHLDSEQQNSILSPQKNKIEPIFNYNFSRQLDQYDAIGINVASKLRSVNPMQGIIAEKLISDILFKAQLETLTPNANIQD